MSSRYPLGTVAFYGPNDKQATMLVASIVSGEGSLPLAVRKWYADSNDVRESAAVQKEVTTFFKANKVVRAVVTEIVVGCPHEEGIDYPRNEECPLCPFWWGRRRR